MQNQSSLASRSARCFVKPSAQPALDNRLDEYFTVLALASVTGTVRRWKKLHEVPVALLPSDIVRNSLRQATTCYLHRMYDASAVLCRATLEFALKERLGALDGNGKRDLEDLIRFAQRTEANGKPILSADLAAKAHDIRIRGNEAIHNAVHRGISVTEPEALKLIGDTGRILTYLYDGS